MPSAVARSLSSSAAAAAAPSRLAPSGTHSASTVLPRLPSSLRYFQRITSRLTGARNRLRAGGGPRPPPGAPQPPRVRPPPRKDALVPGRGRAPANRPADRAGADDDDDVPHSPDFRTGNRGVRQGRSS